MALAVIVPGRLDAPTGGSTWNRRIVEELRARGRAVDVFEVHGGFPRPEADAVAGLDRALGACPAGSVAVIDGLIFGCTPGVVERHATRLRLVPVVHLPLSADPGLAPDAVVTFRDSEARALGFAAGLIITGVATQAMLDGYGVPPARLHLVEPGTDRPSADALRAAQAARAAHGSHLRLLSVATLNPGKGHAALLRALAATGVGHWHLTCAGSQAHSPETVAGVRALVAKLGLSPQVTLAGDLDTAGLAAAYADADVFVLATRRETYGMAVSSALAWGLPIVSTSTGAIPGLVGETAGIVVPVDDEATLGEALGRVLGDAALRAKLADGALRAAERLPSWQDQATAFEHALAAIG
jgi:glycosyltransferase involved in cell wall biosynthesis